MVSKSKMASHRDGIGQYNYNDKLLLSDIYKTITVTNGLLVNKLNVQVYVLNF
jgi:hypothetical protein